MVEVIDLQTSKAGDMLTANAGVLDIEAFSILWATDLPEFVEVPACTVSARIGDLINCKDLWWEADEDKDGDSISAAIAEHVLPFVNRTSSRDGMVQWLEDADVIKRKYPQPIIYLAILQHLQGRKLEACHLLGVLEQKAIGAWRARAKTVAERLGCTGHIF